VHLDDILEQSRLASFEALRQEKKFPPNFEACVCIFASPPSLAPSLSMWRELLADKTVFGAFGMHPHNARFYTDKLEATIEECLAHPRAVALGECGLDFFKDHSPRDVQREVFVRQLRLARRLRKPVVVHSRSAAAETLQLLSEHLPAEHPIHMHCFGDGPKEAEALLARFPNLFIGFTGVITFASAKPQREALAATPLERVLLETDGPYMAPTGAGERLCHPGLIPWVAAAVAHIKQQPLRRVFEQTRENAKKMYGI
jgi:TatD DNase family protein